MLALLMTGARLALHNDPESDDEQHADPTSPSGGMHPLELDEVALHNDHADATSASSAGAKPGARWVKWAERSAAHLQKKVEAVVQSATGAGPTQRESAPRDEVPEHWGLTAREMGRIERRWRSWTSAIARDRPSADGDDQPGALDRLSLAPAALQALQARGVFYGWAVAAVATLALVLEAPVADVAIAVNLQAVGASLRCDEADLARALALAHLFAGLAAPLGPVATGRLAPGAAACACACALAVGLWIASRAQSLGALGFGVALSKLAGQGVLSPLAMNSLHGWWRARRRVVDTAVTAAMCTAILGIAPLLVQRAALAGADAWRGTLGGGALFALLCGAPVLALLLPRPPNAYGQLPDGVAASAAFQGDEALEIADLPTQVWALSDAVASPKFWLAQLALVAVRVHAAGLLFMHGALLPPGLPREGWLVSVAAGAAVAAVAIGLSLEMLRRKHAVLVAALLADALALALASVPLEADGAEMRARVWGALTGALVAAGALTPGPLWCQLFGSVDAHRIELLSACTALAASGLAIGVWAQWYEAFRSVARALRVGSVAAGLLALGVGVALHGEVDGSVQSWQALKAARETPWLASCLPGRQARRPI